METVDGIIKILGGGNTLAIVTILVCAIAFIAWKVSPLNKGANGRLEESVTLANTEMVASLRASYETQIEQFLIRIAAMDAKLTETRDIIQNFQIRSARQQVLLIQFKGMCAEKAIPLPQYMADELMDLLGK